MSYQEKSHTGWGMRLLGAVCILAGLAGITWLGWMWLGGVQVSEVQLSGNGQVPADTLAALARVERGESLYDLKPSFVADRVQRHPWVEKAYVSRLPTGVLSIDVQEREPVALYIPREGKSFYLDANGFQMPRGERVHDVPLLTGMALEYKPLSPVEDAALRSLLFELSVAEASAVISEVNVSGDEVMLYTISGERHGAIPVKMGQGEMGEKLSVLALFWHQAVRGQPEKTFEMVDLRFDGQVITREHGGDADDET